MRLNKQPDDLFKPHDRFYYFRLLLVLFLIVGGLVIIRLVSLDQIRSPFLPPATPTRSANSYAQEGEALFTAGDLEQAVERYQVAASLEPGNAMYWSELARIHTYFSVLQTTIEDRRYHLESAMEASDKAILADPDSVWAFSFRALAYDWSASLEQSDEIGLHDELLSEADTSAVRALLLEPGNPLALAFKAEVLVDQQLFGPAIDLAEEAVESLESLPKSYWMDVYRVYGTVLENNGQYYRAIEQYKEAVKNYPNLTFLYISIGVNYRELSDVDEALFYFDRAARINEQLVIVDPTPYIAIGKTYQNEGEFFIAAVNVEQALAMDRANPNIYGLLGLVYFQARNYESAIPVLKCAVNGCNAEEASDVLCNLGIVSCDQRIEVVRGLELNSSSLVYYYTYASALAAYAGTPEFPDACVDAERIFQLLIMAYPDDPVVLAIVEEGRVICSGIEDE